MTRGSSGKDRFSRLQSRALDESAAVLAILTLLVMFASLAPWPALPESDTDAFPVLSDADDDTPNPSAHSDDAPLPPAPAPLPPFSPFDKTVSASAARLADPGASPTRSPRAPPLA